MSRFLNTGNKDRLLKLLFSLPLESSCWLTSFFRAEDSPSPPLESSSVAFISLDSTMFCSKVLWALRHFWGRHSGTRPSWQLIQRRSCASCCWMEATALFRTSSWLEEEEQEVKVFWTAIHTCSLRASKSLWSLSSSSSLGESWVKSCSSLRISLLLTSSSCSCAFSCCCCRVPSRASFPSVRRRTWKRARLVGWHQHKDKNPTKQYYELILSLKNDTKSNKQKM